MWRICRIASYLSSSSAFGLGPNLFGSAHGNLFPPKLLPMDNGALEASGTPGIAGNKKGEFEVKLSFLANYIQTMVKFGLYCD
jgi:hypothetical protein